MSARRLLQPALVLIALAGPLRAGVDWQPVTAADLAQPQLASDPDAPALVLSWDIEVDDRYYPTGRDIVETIRYKIFDPERAAPLTRLSELSVSAEGLELQRASIVARLTLPDGQVRDFGADAVQERVLVQSGAQQSWAERLFGDEESAKEKFLAVSGLEPGSILDVRISQENRYPSDNFVWRLQKNGVPVLRARCFIRLAASSDYRPTLYLANEPKLDAETRYDPRRDTVLVTASDLPALVAEPFSPPLGNRSVTLFGSYTGRQQIYQAANINMTLHVSPEDGRWAPIAGRYYLMQEDAAFPQHASKALARQLTAGAASETEKARRIHDYVHSLYLRFLASPNPDRPIVRYTSPPSVDVIDFQHHTDVPMDESDFHWLEIALDRVAGLQAGSVLLPDRRVIQFNPELASEMFVPQICTRVMADGAWRYSLPTLRQPIPFGWLPWRYRGQPALVVKDGPQELVDIPPGSADDSTISNTGEFTLGADGSLTGKATQTLTGDPAFEVRARLLRLGQRRRANLLARAMRRLFGDARVRIVSVEGVDDPGIPLRIAYRIQADGYAVVTGKRLIFKTEVFQANASSPFTATTRRYDVVFPYRRTERDDLTLHYPENFDLEAPSAPASSPGRLLSYRISAAYSPKGHYLIVKRTFISNVDHVSAANYPLLKRWFDAIGRQDAHELVLLRRGPAPAPAPEAEAPDDSP